MTFLVERLARLRRHLDHLRVLRPRVTGPEALERDLSLHNDVLFLERIPGFRNVLVHEYVALDMRRVIEGLDELDSIERFLAIVSGIEAEA